MMACGNIKGGNTTFNESIISGISPKSSSISCTSIFSKYMFDLVKNETKEFVDLTLLASQSYNPRTSELEKYLSIGLLSCEDGKNHREPLNLILVLDISGSMCCTLNEKKGFFGKRKTKIDLAKNCVKNIFSKLDKNERLGLITFNDDSKVLLELQPKKNIKESSFFHDINELKAEGSTNIEVGYQPAILMLQSQIEKDAKLDDKTLKPTNNRIIFITDALINRKDEEDILYKLNFESSAKPMNIFTTFIGVGVDFNTDLVTRLSKVRGSNYFAVNSEEEFIKTLQNDFNYIVTPLCFDVYVKFESKKFEIDRTFGSEYDFEGKEKADTLNEMKKGGVLKIETLTAYEKSVGGIKGGVVLIKLKEKFEKDDEIQQDYNMIVSVEFDDIKGEKHLVRKEIDGKLLMEKKEAFASSGVRKAILLSRYVCFVKEFLVENPDRVKKFEERQNFLEYFEKEMICLKDKTLEEELESLKSLIKLNKNI